MHAREIVAHWQKWFGLDAYSIDIQRVSLFQVTSEDDMFVEGVGSSLVGIEIDHSNKQACIYHTRQLTEEDIVHELLHVLNPTWTERQVNTATTELLLSKQDKSKAEKMLAQLADDVNANLHIINIL